MPSKEAFYFLQICPVIMYSCLIKALLLANVTGYYLKGSRL